MYGMIPPCFSGTDNMSPVYLTVSFPSEILHESHVLHLGPDPGLCADHLAVVASDLELTADMKFLPYRYASTMPSLSRPLPFSVRFCHAQFIEGCSCQIKLENPCIHILISAT